MTATGAAPTTTGARRAPSSIPWQVTSIVLLIVVWFVASLITNQIHAGLVPDPLTVVRRFGSLSVHPFAGLTLGLHVLSSVGRWAMGFGAAVIVGLPLGILLGATAWVRAAVSPLFEFIRYIPPFAWIPLAILWLGASQTSQALVVFIAAFPAVVINAQVAAVGVDRLLTQASRTMGATPLRRLVGVVTPLAMPGAISGVRIALSNGWMALIAAEMIAGRQGVGFLIIQGQENGDIPVIMVGMVAIAITATLIDLCVVMMGRRLTAWRTPSGRN